MDKDVFNPFKGIESAILNSVPVKGGVYFATDTKRIYYSDGESFLPMGGNNGVWYGKMTLTDVPEPGEVDFPFNFDQIEGNENIEDGKFNLPNIDDLIFNIPDGCFYRVKEIDSSSILCTRLTVSGGGGGSGGSSGAGGTMSISRVGDLTINTLLGNECIIQYTFSALDAAGQLTGKGTTTLLIDGITQNVSFDAVLGLINEINIGPYLLLGSHVVRIIVSGNIGGLSNITQSKSWNVLVTKLDVIWDYDETTINENDTFEINWTVASSIPHLAHIIIQGQTINDEITSMPNRSLTINPHDDYGIVHGSYLIGLYVTADIGGLQVTTDTVYHKIIFVDRNFADTIISIGLIVPEVDQYDTLNIPIILYDPNTANTSNKVTAVLSEDGVVKDTWENYENATQYYWNYTPINAGEKILSITSNGKEERLTIVVNDLGLLIQEVPGYSFKFKASDLASNNNLQNWNYGNNYNVEFSSGFDWINGGLLSEIDDNSNVRLYINVKAGDTLTFNYLPLLGASIGNGFCIKTIFKITNCKNYDAQGIFIGRSDIGILIKANEAIFKTSLRSISVPYCEDTYIELEFDVWKFDNSEKLQNYIITWLDGVPAGVTTYNNGDILNSEGNIIIGSNDCDVLLYLIKVYNNKHLTDEEHLTNFILDASNSQDLLARYHRNDILDDNGEISYSKLGEKNPNCEIYLYEIPRMTTTKKDKVTECSYLRFHYAERSDGALQSAENVTMTVLGTSSAAYGLAAFNFNSTFEDGFTDYSKNSQGEHIDKWAMTKNSIPINDFNTKVNVASCEGTNNAINQKWYEEYVNKVFVTEYKKKNPLSRHTMEFINMGAVFIKDKNQVTNSDNGVGDNVFKDTNGYISNPYFKLYSICNMGNIKRNEGVFSDPENPYDVIMEVSDNLSVYLQMTGILTEDKTSIKGEWTGDKFYPIVTSATYFKTEDSKAVTGKDYYIRAGESGNYTYTKVLNIIPDETDVSSYYEFVEAGGTAATEVFEWRAVPEDTWKTIKNNDGRDMRKQAENAWTSLVAWFAANNPEAATGDSLDLPVHYDSYTFKGYTSRSDRKDINNNAMAPYTPDNQILKGLTISTYAGDYDHDTYRYRMAKMLNECEDHLIMDEIVFHYLFIERHTLIDNVAKNTFWHTEDLLHWSMIKDYDNDTSDGNDNSGHLTLTYGYEVLDKVNHSTESTASDVFNASSSVWLHFINGLLEARTRVYLYLDTSTIRAWDAAPYLEEFNKWQSALPERVWIEDYYRKYLRPKEVYGATLFLPMLEGGKKTHQRKLFETYQEAYMSSEYQGRLCATSIIDIRANGKNINTMSFPMTMYSDCYIRIAAGSGQDPNVRERVRRGEVHNITLPVTGDANDMTTYFYLANYVTSLGGIERLLPKKVDISLARRLREFTMTSLGAAADIYIPAALAEEDHSFNSNHEYYEPDVEEVNNPEQSNLYQYSEQHIQTLENDNSISYIEYLPTEDEEIDVTKTYYLFNGYIKVINPVETDFNKYYILETSLANVNLREANFENNTMLEKLILLNCPYISNSLDLVKCINLKYLDIEDSGFTGISLAPNAPIETLHLNKPVSLSMSNLYKISDYTCQGYDRLTGGLYTDTVDNTEYFNINNNILQNSTIQTILTPQDNEEKGRLLYNLLNINWTLTNATDLNGTNIKILETLKKLRPVSADIGHISIHQSLALSGKLTITASAYDSDNSLEIYNNYINTEVYPNLELIFESNNAKLYTVNIVNGNDEVIWTKQSNGNSSLSNEFYSNGPKGSLTNFISRIITKTDTMQYTYTFDNKWELWIEGVRQEDIAAASEQHLPINNSLNIIGNILIKPIFTQEDREYTVKFYNGDTLLETNKYNYGERINSILPKSIPEKDDSELELFQTYCFLGWSLQSNATKPLNLTDDYIVNNDLNYYAVFSGVEDVRTDRNIHLGNFDFTLKEINAYTDNYDESFNVEKGYIIKPNPEARLQGKITIPSFYNNLPIIEISGFNTGDTFNITGIYFKSDSELRTIGANCFLSLSNLKYFIMPNKLRVISLYAFGSIPFLKLVLNNKNDDTYVFGGPNTVSIGSYAFNLCFNASDNCTTFKIPASIKKLDLYAISFIKVPTSLSKIVIGEEGNPTSISERLTNSIVTNEINNSLIITMYFSNNTSNSEEIIESIGVGIRTLGNIQYNIINT